MKHFAAKPLAAVACLATVLMAGQSAAADPQPSADASQNVSMKLRFRDLNLSRSQDAETLYKRIQLSARMVCNDNSSSWDGSSVRTKKRCYEATVEDAVSRLHSAQLTAWHQDYKKRVASSE